METLGSQRRAQARSPLRPQQPLQLTRDETVFCGEAFPPQGPPRDCPCQALLARVPRRYLRIRTAIVSRFFQILSRRKAFREGCERLRSPCLEGSSSRSEHVALRDPLRSPKAGTLCSLLQAMKVTAPQFGQQVTEGGSAYSRSIEAMGRNGCSEVHPPTACIVRQAWGSQNSQGGSTSFVSEKDVSFPILVSQCGGRPRVRACMPGPAIRRPWVW